MIAGWSAPLETVHAYFRGARATGLVWRVHETRELFALDGDRCVLADGSEVAFRPAQAVSLMHVADAELHEIVPWREWQRARGVPFAQLERTAPPHASVEDLEHLLVERGGFNIDIEPLRARGYRNGGKRTADTNEPRSFVKTYRHCGQAYAFTIDLLGEAVVHGPRSSPRVVLFEVARDLAAGV
jgi:hypothetical protein